MPQRAKAHRAPASALPSNPDALRPSAAKRGYGRRWQAARLVFLAEHPLCDSCAAAAPPRITEATDVDHRIPHRGHAELFWTESNWQSLCGPCHSRKTAQGQ